MTSSWLVAGSESIGEVAKAVAQLVPLTKIKRTRDAIHDPLLQVDEYSFDGAVGALTNQDIDGS